MQAVIAEFAQSVSRFCLLSKTMHICSLSSVFEYKVSCLFQIRVIREFKHSEMFLHRLQQ